jgi:hypothetical protein
MEHHEINAGASAQRVLFREAPVTRPLRLSFLADELEPTDAVMPTSPRPRGSFSDYTDAWRGPRSPLSPRSDDDAPSPAAHRRKSIPVRSLPSTPIDERARAQEGIVVLDVYSKFQ